MKDCCILHQKAHAKMKTLIKTLHRLVGGNPRNWMMIYELWRQELSASMLAVVLSEQCPCEKGNDVLTKDDISTIEQMAEYSPKPQR